MASRIDPLKVYNILLKSYGPRDWWPGDTREETMIGAILTQNTAWSNVEKAINNLKGAGKLSGKAIAKADTKALAELIKPAGYFNQKTKRLRDFFSYLDEIYDLDLDRFFGRDLFEVRTELLSLKGIGPETADSILLYAGELPTFVIDAYTFRIFKRLGLEKRYYQKQTKSGIWKDDYHTLQKFFLDNLKSEVQLYNEYHALMVEHGKRFCRSRPVCDGCVLGKVCEKRV